VDALDAAKERQAALTSAEAAAPACDVVASAAPCRMAHAPMPAATPALAACLVPVRRALRIDPAEVLRVE
jgi:hypothetical protein